MKTMAAFHAQATAASRAAGALPKQIAESLDDNSDNIQLESGVMIFDVRSSAAVACCCLLFFGTFFRSV